MKNIHTKENPARVAIYCRVSSLEQEKEGTIETQHFTLQDLIRQRFGDNFDVVKVYEDDGWTGTDTDRPGLDKLREDIYKDEWDYLFTYSSKRLSRAFMDGVTVVEEILNAGKEIIYKNGFSPNKKTKMISRIMAAVDDEDRENILQQTYDGKLRRAAAGVINSSTAPYGYNLVIKQSYPGREDFVQTHYEINEEEAKVVRMIFDWVANDRLSTRQVVVKLAERGILPRKSKRGVWGTSTLNTLLKNETYIGKAYFGASEAVEPKRRLVIKDYYKVKKTSRRMRPRDEWIPITVPAILEGEEGKKLFEKARQQLSNNRRESTTGNKEQTAYLLGGRIRCACGYTRNRSGSQEKKNIYYTCSSAKSCYPDKPCSIGGVNTRIADEYVWNKLTEILTDPIEFIDVVKNYYKEIEGGIKSGESEELIQMQEQIQKLKKQKDRLVSALQKGFIDEDEMEEKVTPLNKLLRTMTKREEALKATVGSREAPELDDELLDKIVLYAPEALKKLSFTEKKEIVFDCISNIVAVPGTLDVSGSLEVHDMILLTDRNKLKLKGNKANIASNYYVYLKTISRNCWTPKRW